MEADAIRSLKFETVSLRWRDALIARKMLGGSPVRTPIGSIGIQFTVLSKLFKAKAISPAA